jgi:hypothetical protein
MVLAPVFVPVDGGAARMDAGFDSAETSRRRVAAAFVSLRWARGPMPT